MTIEYQSAEKDNPSSHRGVSTTPPEIVVAISGSSALCVGLPRNV